MNLRTAISVPIDENTLGNRTLRTVEAGRTFVVYQLYLQAEGEVDLQVKSGTGTLLSGTITLSANETLDLHNGEVPVFIGAAAGDDLVLNLSANIQVNGFALVTEMA